MEDGLVEVLQNRCFSDELILPPIVHAIGAK